MERDSRGFAGQKLLCEENPSPLVLAMALATSVTQLSPAELLPCPSWKRWHQDLARLPLGFPSAGAGRARGQGDSPSSAPALPFPQYRCRTGRLSPGSGAGPVPAPQRGAEPAGVEGPCQRSPNPGRAANEANLCLSCGAPDVPEETAGAGASAWPGSSCGAATSRAMGTVCGRPGWLSTAAPGSTCPPRLRVHSPSAAPCPVC